MGVSINRGTPSHHLFIDGLALIQQPFWGTPHVWNPPFITCFMPPELYRSIPLDFSCLQAPGAHERTARSTGEGQLERFFFAVERDVQFVGFKT